MYPLDFEEFLQIYNFTAELKDSLQTSFIERNPVNEEVHNRIMLTSMYGRATKMQLLTNAQNINYGAIYENAVAQELKAHGFKLYYFAGKKTGELDFVIEYNGKIMPI